MAVLPSKKTSWPHMLSIVSNTWSREVLFASTPYAATDSNQNAPGRDALRNELAFKSPISETSTHGSERSRHALINDGLEDVTTRTQCKRMYTVSSTVKLTRRYWPNQ